MFHDEYAFFSRQSKFMQAHFKEYAKWVESNYLSSKDDFVVEIGSNDGIMLENFKNMGLKHLGVDPSSNVVEVARSHGVNSVVSFFGLESAKDIVREYGHAKALISANVMCHLPDLNDIGLGAYHLLEDDGVLIFEDPYLGDMLNKVSYDQIYDEHVFIFSAMSVSQIFGRSGFELINLYPVETHGGSMRYVLAKKGVRDIDPVVNKTLQDEKDNKLHLKETYDIFKTNCEESKSRLLNLLNDAYDNGLKVAGYGATSKSTTILNYCGIQKHLIEYISDTTPIKQDKLSPGVHIPVKSYDYFQKNLPDIVLLLAWNHSEEIILKEEKILSKDLNWISHLPKMLLNQ